jgi:uncharacterized protein
VNEPATSVAESLLAEDEAMVVWWASRTECLSALKRKRREGNLDGTGEAQAKARLMVLELAWSEVKPVTRVRLLADGYLEVHKLKAADALQLGSASRWLEDEPTTTEFVSLDKELRAAAKREGFTVLPQKLPESGVHRS